MHGRAGMMPLNVAFLPSAANEETLVRTTEGLAKEGCGQAMVKPDGAPVYPGNEANQAFPSFLSTDLAFLTLRGRGWGGAVTSHSQSVALGKGTEGCSPD